MLNLSPRTKRLCLLPHNPEKISFKNLLLSTYPDCVFSLNLFGEFLEIFDLYDTLLIDGPLPPNILNINEIIDTDKVLQLLDSHYIKSTKKTIDIQDLQFFQSEVYINGTTNDSPITVVQCGDLLTKESRYMLIDGYHRIAQKICDNDVLDIPCVIYL